MALAMVAFSAPGMLQTRQARAERGRGLVRIRTCQPGTRTHRRTDRDQKVAEGVDDLQTEAVCDLGFQPSEDRRVRACPADP